MAGETTLTIVGNLTADPELRFTPSGAAVANFTIASTPRRYDSQTSQWVDGDPLFLRCTIWRQAAENVAESFQRGDRVIAQGRLEQRSFETKEGEKRTLLELQVDEIGPSVKWRPATVQRAQRSGDSWGENKAPGRAGGAASDDPWASTPASSGGGGAWSPDEPPFHHSPSLDKFLV
jgi:single-strand DNA-binding protein